MDQVDKLYKCYETLANNVSNISEHESEYLQILEAAKGDSREKLLAAQFIPKFLKDFPHLIDVALDRQLDLVEDDDVNIRKQAIKHLPNLCKGSSIHISKIADILAQMFLCDDPMELALVNTSLVTVLKLDVKGTLAGLFTQIKSTEEEVVRKRAINFICTKLKFLPPEIMTKDVEEYIIQECKEIFPTANGEEFNAFMNLLSNFKCAKTLPGQQAVLEIILSQVELDKKFSPENPDHIARLLQCMRSALPFFSHYVSSTPFVKYISEQVLCLLKKIPELDGIDIGLECVKAFAELSPYCSDLENVDEYLEKVYDTLLEYIPSPPADSANIVLASELNLQFTHIESLMYTFHQLLKKNPGFLTSEDNATRFKEFKLRLIYLNSCIKPIKTSLADKSAKPEEAKLKTVALCTMSNISSMIKDLFHNPPTYKTSITLSWKQGTSLKRPVTGTSATNTNSTSPSKRKEVMPPDTHDRQAKRGGGKAAREIYTPPGGKYSSNIKYYPSRGFSSYRGQGRRGRQRFY